MPRDLSVVCGGWKCSLSAVERQHPSFLYERTRARTAATALCPNCALFETRCRACLRVRSKLGWFGIVDVDFRGERIGHRQGAAARSWFSKGQAGEGAMCFLCGLLTCPSRNWPSCERIC